MTKIRRVVKRQYYMKTEYRNSTGEPRTKYKRMYDRIVYLVQFPKSLDVTSLLGKELTFEKRGELIIIKPKPQLE